MTNALPQGAPVTPFKIGLAGYGKMGASMVLSWQKAGLIKTIDIYDPFCAEDSVLKTEDAFLEKAATWDVLILAIKPQTLNSFLDGKEGALPRELPILSILAGKTTKDLSKKFREQNPLVRAMPNTPAAIGMGMSVAVENPTLNPSQRQMVESLLLAMGHFLWTKDEADMDAITALSGSGPAYVFYLTEALAKAGEKAGLEAEISMALARQTIIGAAALADAQSSTPAHVLRENVTSPNGTTAAGLSVLMDGRLQELLNQTIEHATARSKELSKS